MEWGELILRLTLSSEFSSFLCSLLLAVSVHLSTDDLSSILSSNSSLISLSSFLFLPAEVVLGTFINVFYSSTFGVSAGVINLSLWVSELVGRS